MGRSIGKKGESDMSISAKDARAKSMETELRIRGKSYNDLLESQDRAIEYAIKDGRTSCCFYIHDTIFSNEWEDRMREHYRTLGYKFRPTGYIGGVLQRTEEIYW